MRIALVDVDSKIPNIALQRISSYHKHFGDEVALIRLGNDYYKGGKRIFLSKIDYDSVYESCIFPSNQGLVMTDAPQYYRGGTGYSLITTLPPFIENCEQDTALYPSDGNYHTFLSRGCIRKCAFCVVPQKEGRLRIVRSVESLPVSKVYYFWDNNFLALPECEMILGDLIARRYRFRFAQGLDIRCLTQKKWDLLRAARYDGEMTFALDDLSLAKFVQGRLDGMMANRKKWGVRWYVYVNEKTSMEDAMARLVLLRDAKCLAYLTRDKDCMHRKDFRDLAAWCNQPGMFKTISYEQFKLKRNGHGNA